ncbi:MAG: acyl-CoA dehydrogenase family protein [Haloferacaceae archaeon]
MHVTEPDDLREWRATVERFVTEEFGVDYFRERYRDREYPHELYDAVVDRGWLGVQVPEAHGGEGRSHVEMAVLLEALGSYGYDFGMPVLLSTTGVLTLLDHGSEAQCERFVPRLLDGDVRFSIGVTEPQSGSDAAGVETRAERRGDTYHVTGEKTYQSGAAAPGNHVAAYVRTDPDSSREEGLSLLLVPNDAPGVDVETLPLVARKAVGTNRITFDDAEVPAANRVGDEGEGWTILGDHLTREHTYMAAVMVGNAATALETASAAVEDRERFGRRVADFQAVEHRLADLRTEVDAARLLVYRAASKLDDGSATRRHASQAKLKAGEVLKEVSSESVQLLGGAGLHPDNDVERYWREGASATIAGATSEIHRSIIASHLRE